MAITFRTGLMVVTASTLLIATAIGGLIRSQASTTTVTQPQAPITDATAVRFLNQAAYGVTDADIADVKRLGYASWIDQQMVIPTSSNDAHTIWSEWMARRAAMPATANASISDFTPIYYAQVVTGKDQLRQRVQLALSEIMVASYMSSGIQGAAVTFGGYWDMLGRDAFGNFRTLLQDVSMSPAMGVYLSSLGSARENPATGQQPDENYAREVMQLMTIGLFQLNPDGTRKLDASGQPIPTYTHDDIVGLAKVISGMGWARNPMPATIYRTNMADSEASLINPMLFYPGVHSISAKSFLGVTIPASTTENGPGDMKIALDTLFNHPNVGPFISRQLIQRLVTSNPSPAYVGRVAAVFNNNGSGARGDLKAVVKAILLDAEARNPSTSSLPTYGKLREPVVIFAGAMRTFGATSASGAWNAGVTSDPSALGQTAMNSPSVFNFFRPGYVAPRSKMGDKGQVTPEMQIVSEVSVAGYLNTMQTLIRSGYGAPPTGTTGSDINLNPSSQAALADNPNALIANLNRLLFAGTMSQGLQANIARAVNSVAMPAATAAAADIATARSNRARLAIFLAMASPEYLVQQ